MIRVLQTIGGNGGVMVDSVPVERTVRGRVEVRNAREHRRLERLFRAAQEARNAIIEDLRPARAWNLRELRRQRRVDPAWSAENWFDWAGPETPRESGKLVRYTSRVVRNGAVTRLRRAGKMPLASEYTVALARSEASRVARGVKKGGRKPLRYRRWRERSSVEWERLPGIVFAEGSRRHGKLRGGDTGRMRFRLYEDLPKGAEMRSLRLVRTRRGERGVGPSVYEVHVTVRERRRVPEGRPVACLVGVDAGGRATATDDCGATTSLGAVRDRRRQRVLQRALSRCGRRTRGRRKARGRLSRQHARERVRARSLCRKKASRMVRRGRIVVAEDLDHAKMRRRGRGRRKRGMNRSLAGGSPGMFRQALQEVAVRKGGCAVVEVGAAYTSRQCVVCGSRDTELSRVRVTCRDCGVHGDRDVSAAGNLVLKFIAGLGTSGPVGGVVSPGSASGVSVRSASVLCRTESLLPESLGNGLLARALAMWREHTPDGTNFWQKLENTICWQ